MTDELILKFWEKLSDYSFQILGTILLFILGWFVSKWVSRVVTRFLEKTRLNQALKRLGVEEVLSNIDRRLNAPKFFGELLRWCVFTLFLMACSEMLGLVQFSQFLAVIIGYLPNIFIAAIIFIITAFLADFSQKIVVGTLKKERITYSRVLGKGLSSAIWILAVLAILYQLKIVPTLISMMFIGVTALIVLVLGISFGLGGKDIAAKILKGLEDKFK